MKTTARWGAALGVWVTVIVGFAGSGRTQDYYQRVDFDTDFVDEPAWILGIRPAVGYDDQEGDLFPQLGLAVGYVFANHLYLGGTAVSRLNVPFHFRLALRLGLFYVASDFAMGTGVSLGVMTIPRNHELGFTPVWGADFRYRLGRHHFLTLFTEADLLYDLFGFRDTRVFLSGGVGWSVTF